MTKLKLPILALLAALAAVPAAALADHPRDDYRHRQGSGLWTRLANVSVDLRRGHDVIPIGYYAGRFTHIEIRAREAPIPLDAIEVRLASGEVLRPYYGGLLRPDEVIRIPLPYAAAIDSIVVDYDHRRHQRFGNLHDRWEVGRLVITARAEERRDDYYYPGPSDRRGYRGRYRRY